ncbi:hypothetical protein [Deinococcus roseus]|uniref:NERD domain-containing protein n=1 Tax=Deinococcus roseus TaxID=392414 RepID=A0ABQ2DH16_9DEIO|nr:hypothetical protein [Deinococcus roseus]GGJ54602.1 hypothetical protein GCM10008938_45860 [Deinococcus roseus]
MFFRRKPLTTLPQQLLPRAGLLQETLSKLRSKWVVLENIQIDHLHSCTVLIAGQGCFVLFLQDTAGVILHNPRSLIVNDQNLMPQVALVQQGTASLETRLGHRVHAVMVFRQLIEPAELKSRSLSASVTREWEIDSVKIVTWDSLLPYLSMFTRKTLSETEVQGMQSRIARLEF